MNFIEINFNNEKHTSYIYQLSKRNNFYLNDIGSWLYSKNEKSTFNNWNLYYLNNNNPNIIKFPYWKGLLCILDKKIIGFIIYYERHYINDIGNFLSIEFMLIDKLYQRNGYGKLIIEYLKEKYDDKNYISVCIENKNKYIDFYKNIGFIEVSKSNNKLCSKHYKEFSSFIERNDFSWLYLINKKYKD